MNEPIDDLEIRVVGANSAFHGFIGDLSFGFTLPIATVDVDRFNDLMSATRTRDFRSEVSGSPNDPYAEASRLGMLLFDAVFADPDALEAFRKTRDMATGAGRRVRLRLFLDGAPELINLPWELLFYNKKHVVFSEHRYVARHVTARGVPPPSAVPVVGPLRILVVTSAPTDLPPLDIDREYEFLQEALAQPIAANTVYVERLAQPGFNALADALERKNGWHVVHYIGHGDVGPSGGLLALCDEAERRHDASAEQLGQLLTNRESLRLVVLNACRTATGPNDRPLSGVAYELLRYGAPAAVAMQFPVTDGKAIQFSKSLYDTLAKGESLDEAVATARQAMLGTPEWVTPVLMLRATGELFDISIPPPAPEPIEATPSSRVPRDLTAAVAGMTPRPWIAETVDTWLQGSQRLLLLAGALGMGKSVLLASMAVPAGDEIGESATARPVVHAFHAFSSTLVGASTDARSFVLSVGEQLAATVPRFAPVAGDSDGAARDRLDDASGLQGLFRHVIAQPLLAAQPEDPIIIIVDGVDEADTGGALTPMDLVARLVQLDVPLKLIVSSSNDSDLDRLALNRSASVTRLDLSAPEHRAQVVADVKAYLRARLTTGGGAADGPAGAEQRASRLAKHLSAASAGNFLYAASVAAHASEMAETAGPGAEQAELLLPSDLSELYEVRLEHLVKSEYETSWSDGWVKDLEPLLGSLAVAQAPVPAAALENWLSATGPQIVALSARFEQIIRRDGECFVLAHPAFAQFLLASAPNVKQHPFVVDAGAASERIVSTTLAWTQKDLLRARFEGGAYTLVHLGAHLQQLVARGAVDLVDGCLKAIAAPTYLAALASCVDDPVLVGKPYRDLTDVLVGLGRASDVNLLVRCIAASSDPAVRQTIFDMLIACAAVDDVSAAASITRLAVDSDSTLSNIALRATCTLTAESQAKVFREVVATSDTERRIAASYALYANGLDDDTLLDRVLTGILDGVSLLRPLAARPQLEFFTEVTVTNYVNRPNDLEVSELTSKLWRNLFLERLPAVLVRNRLVGFAVELMARPTAERVLRIATGQDDEEGREQIGGRVPGADAARRVTAALDPAVDLARVEGDLAVVLDSDIPVLRILGGLVVGVHNVSQPDLTTPIVEQLFLAGSSRRRLWLLAGHAVVLPSTPVGWIEPLEQMTRHVVADGNPPDPSDEPQVRGRPIDLLFAPLGFAYAKARREMTVFEDLLRSDEPSDRALRVRCLQGLGVAGLYFADFVLGELDRFLAADVVDVAEIVGPLAMISGLHPLQVRAWADRHTEGSPTDGPLAGRVTASIDVEATRAYLEALGFYNNAVHLNVNYSKMRDGLGKTVFSLFLDSSSRKEWAKRYARAGLAMLREADFELIKWTRPDER